MLPIKTDVRKQKGIRAADNITAMLNVGTGLGQAQNGSIEEKTSLSPFKEQTLSRT